MSLLSDRYRTWLIAEGYQSSTIDTSTREAKLIETLWLRGAPIPRRLRWTGKRLIEAGLVAGQLAKQIEVLFEHQARGRAKAPRRKYVLRSFDDAAWRLLVHKIRETESDEARVLEVMCAHALRIGDVLRLKREELRRGIRTGTIEHTLKGGTQGFIKISDSYQRLWDAWQADASGKTADDVAGWLCPTGTCASLPGAGAYKRVQRALKKIAREVGIEERVFLHRLRRTVAVQALREDRDIGAVQQLLKHTSPATTARYLDEARPDAVAELTERVRKRFT